MLVIWFKDYFKLIMAYTILLLTGCSIGSTSNSNTQNMPTGVANIQMNNVTTIPTINSNSSEYLLTTISNNSDKNITLQNTQISANGKILAPANVRAFIDLGNCLQINAKTSCSAKVFTNTTFQSYLLSLTYSDSSGTSYNVNQTISLNALLPIQNGFIYDSSQLSANNSGLTIPFRLTNSYSNISVLINNQPTEFSCYKNNYNLNTLCSVNIKSNSITKGLNSNNRVKIIGYDSKGAIKNTAILVLINTQAANIITSGVNVVINPDDGTRPQTLYLVNNGLVSATGLTISPTNPVTVTSNTCGTTLLANANCSFVINVTGSPSSGQSYVAVSYSNGQSNQVLYFNVSYANKTGPNLILTQSGNFTNIASGTGPIFMSVNVSNSGITNLSSLQFNNLNLQKSNMSSYVAGSTCYNGMNLNTGVSCTMILSYSPNAAESGTVTFIPIASYTESGGQTITYANSILNIPYSAVTIPIFTTISDSGYVITSSNNPPTTWAGVNVPSISGQTPNNMARNGNNYLFVDTSGLIESSSNRTTWVTQTNPSGQVLYHLYCIGNNTCFAVGASGVILKTTNGGNNWVQQISNVSSGVILHSIVCNLNTCVAVGGTGSANSGTIAITTDFTNWSVPTSTLNTTAFIGVTYDTRNNEYIAVGNGGTIFASTNGINWQQVTSPTTNPLFSVTCGITGCVAVGNNGTIIFSSNGNSWSTVTSGTTNKLYCVAYNGVFVVTAANRTILWSTNGQTWTAAATITGGAPTTSNLYTVTSNL